MDPPIYLCENPQGHSVCSTCHETLKKNRKSCPECRQEMKSRRNVTLERMLESMPNKTKCKFNGCNFKRSDAEAVKKHEDECDNRYVPCANCDAEISLRGLAQHVMDEHCDEEFEMDIFGYTLPIVQPSSESDKVQAVMSVAGHKFLFNWCSLDDDLTLFWVAYIGRKNLSSNYRYTLQVESKEEAKDDVFEGTRYCIPCDLSHTDIKKKKWALLLDKDLIVEATREDGNLHYTLTINKSL